MHVIEVIPLRRGVAITALSYYSKTAYAPGTIVTVPIRGADCRALVLTSTPVSATKTALRSATFTLRKLPVQSKLGHVPPTLVQTAETLQRSYPATTGAILYALLPHDLTDGSWHFADTPSSTHTPSTENTTPQLLQATLADRFTIYQSHVRSTLARDGSVLCIVPTGADVAGAVARLGTGMRDRVAYLSSHSPKATRRKQWQLIQSATRPLLIVTTPQYAVVDRPDLKSLILEQAGSSHYRQRSRPHLDYRDVFETLARDSGWSLILGDTVLRTEHEYRRRSDALMSYDEPPKRLIFPARLRVSTHPERSDSSEPFPLFTSETIDRIATALSHRQNVFLYAARRGLAPLIVCFDCGTIVRCPESGNPYSLLRTTSNGQEKRWFVDTTSGRRVRAADTCVHCGSWRLRERGIGIQHIESALPEHFPDVPVITFDSTTATTAKKARALHDEAAAKRGAIILGTNLALPYLPDTIAISCVTSVEAAASIPSWRADEMLFRLLLELREKSSQEVIVQTRSEVSDVVNHAERGAVEAFYNEEIELREMLHYPPTTVLILLSWSGRQDAVTETETQLNDTLTTYSLHCYSHPYSRPSKVKRYALMRVPTAEWPQPDVVEALRALPPHVTVEINPDRIV